MYRSLNKLGKKERDRETERERETETEREGKKERAPLHITYIIKCNYINKYL